jgi:hypothetical protein
VAVPDPAALRRRHTVDPRRPGRVGGGRRADGPRRRPVGPITLVTDPAKSLTNPNNPAITAGFTFLGQFLDHDMTFDPTSSLARRQDPEAIRNLRIPALDLDSVYGGGPVASPQLYDQTVDGGQTSLLVEEIPGSGPSPSTARPGWMCPATASWSPWSATPATTRT